MSGLIGGYSAFVSGLSLAKRCALLAIAVGFVAVPVVAVAWSQQGALAAQAAAAAAVVCLATGLIAMMSAQFGRGTPASVAWVLAGDGLAMGLPLVAAVVVQRSGHPWHDAGFFGRVVLFFLATLIVRTLLVAPTMNSGARPAGGLPKAEAGA